MSMNREDYPMQILELVLNSPNPEAQGDFFAEHFGLPVEVEAGRVMIQIGASRLIFEYGDFPARAHYAFDIPENQFAEAAAWLRKRLPILHDEHGTWHFESSDWNADSLYFYDADKNISEFISRHNQPTTSSSPFTGESLVSISEVGLVTPAVIETVTVLKRELGLKAWRGAGSESFTAVGDENGLFIVAAEGRAWRPEIVGAKAAQIRVKIAGEAKVFKFSGLPYAIEATQSPSAARSDSTPPRFAKTSPHPSPLPASQGEGVKGKSKPSAAQSDSTPLSAARSDSTPPPSPALKELGKGVIENSLKGDSR
jgi:catechol-2,3-dioxygenase